MKQSSKRSELALVAIALLAVVGTSFYSQGQTQNQPPRPARSPSDEMLDRWNDIGNKLIAMAQDFPEDKYDFKVQKYERTFAQNLLHAAALDFVLIRRISGSNLGPDFGPDDNPSRDVFKTKADVVKFVQEAVAEGAKVIQQQGDAGLENTSKFLGDRLAHNSSIWTFAIEHSGEHYGQLVVYYRANNMVPPDSRRDQAQESQQPSAPRVVELKASDGIVLKASYFAAAKPGPGVLLLHQFNRTRKAWDDLAGQLAAAGINTLTLDMRGFGESGGTPNINLTDAERAKVHAARSSDIETALQYLVSQPGVKRDVIGVGGAGEFGVGQSVDVARQHSAEVKSLVLLSGEAVQEGLEFMRQASQLPGLFVVSDDDEYPPTVEVMELLYITSSNPGKKFVHYSAAKEAPWLWYEGPEVGKAPTNGGHGTDMIKVHPELPGIIVDWFVTTLIKTPGHAPADTVASAAIINQIRMPDGVAQVTQQLMEARQRDPEAQLFPEITVSAIGQDHMRAGEPKLAVEVLKLVLLAYPESADAHETLAEAYLADGQKDLARQHAEKALTILNSHAAPASSWTDTEQYRGEIRSGAQNVLKKLSAPLATTPASATAGRVLGTVFRDCPDCPEMVVIPAGDFMMGSSDSEKLWATSRGAPPDAVSDESPLHKVQLQSFALGRYDVTRGEYEAFVRETGYPAPDGCYESSMPGSNHQADWRWPSPDLSQNERYPVTCVSWQDAKAYVSWLNDKLHRSNSSSSGVTYSLPSESEWEYAARAGTKTRFWWGDDDKVAADFAWFKDNSSNQTHSVGLKPANPFGLYDIVGNVWQWTEDCYAESYTGAPTDGGANEVGKDCLRSDRGGSWLYPAWLLRPATRERNPGNYRDMIMGFRLARTFP